jgi:Flp pilus assembly protein TadG
MRPTDPNRQRATARRRARQSGNAMIEGALITLAYFTIIMGVFEFGRMTYVYDYMSHAARDGSRWASLHGSTSSTPATETALKSYLSTWAIGIDMTSLSGNGPGGVMLSYPSAGSNAPGNTVVVNLKYNYVPTLGYWWGSSITLSSSSQMTILQ